MMRPLLPVTLSALLLGSLALAGAAANVRRGPARATVRRYESQAKPLAPAPADTPEGTLLDEVGKLRRKVSPPEAAGWQGQLHVPSARENAARLARLHLWLGEYRLAGQEDPEAAKWHFRQAIALCKNSSSNFAQAELKGRATYDFAIARFLQGAYHDATQRFQALLNPKTAQAGYSRNECALWQRHAGACWGYHQRRLNAGITEPVRTDPYCGAASLARCFKALQLPSDKPSLQRVCRVTGFGSNLQDLLDAGRKRGLSAYAVSLDEAGMRAVPKPVVVHVEHDHFVALLRADSRGVVYGCSDCGGWPGGEREVTWDQWRLMEPGACALFCRPGSVTDQAVREALSARRVREGEAPAEPRLGRREAPGIRLAALETLRGPLLGQLSTLTALLKGHLFRCLTATQYFCGSPPDTLHCVNYIECCLDCAAENAVNNATTGGADALAPHAGDPVNLATLEEEYSPPGDLSVYNPTGPSVSWGRSYNSLRTLSESYPCEDFGAGWTHPYNVNLYDPAVRMNLQLVPTVQSSATNNTGSDAPGTGLTWDIVRAGSTVATSSSTGGWNVQIASNTVRLTAPSGTASNPNYTVRWKVTFGMTTTNYSLGFDVHAVREIPAGTTLTFTSTGSNAPGTGLTWDVRLSGTTIATSSLPSGWGVVYVGSDPFPLKITPPLTATASGSYEVRYKIGTMMGMSLNASATFGVLAHRFLPTGGSKYVIWPNGSRSEFSTSTPPTAGSTPVYLAATVGGTPYFLQWDYSATEPLGVVTLVASDRSAWTFGQLGRAGTGPSVYCRPTQLTDRLGNYLSFTYGGCAGLTDGSITTAAQIYSGFPLLSAIKDSGGTSLLTFNRATDGTGALLSVDDRYSRSVYYHVSQYNTVNVPAPNPAYFIEVDQVSLIVSTGTGSPPARYTYGYTDIDFGHSSPLGHEETPFLTSITVPSPTGTGTATSTIEYGSGTGYVSALQDANGNRREYSAVASDQTQVTLKDSLGTTVQHWTVAFNSDMTPAWRTDGSNTTKRFQKLYSDTNSPHRPSSIKDGNLLETLLTYDAYGNVLTSSSPKGTTTTYTLDYSPWPLGRLTSVQEGTKTATSFSYYEPGGLLYQVTSPIPGTSGGSTVTTTLTYDSLGNVLTVVSPGNNAVSTKTTTFNYTSDGMYSQSAAIGQPLTATDNLSHVTHFRYGTRGTLSSILDAESIETDLSYNLADQTTQVTLPATGENGMGQSYTLNTYQYVGGPLATAKIYDESNTLKRTVTYAYGPEGETASVTGSTEPVAYTYDAAYRLASLSDGNSHSTAYSYNTAGYISQVTYPGSDTLSYTSYDDAGNLLQRVDGRSITTNYVYSDGDGLLSAIQYPASTSLNVGLSYDGYDRLTSMTDGTGSHSYSYDDLDALTSETTTYTGISGKTLNYGYYSDGSRSSMTGAAGSFAYYYDGGGRMTSVVNPYSETSAWTYLNNNWLKTQQLANNATTTYTYDALARVTDLVTRAGPNPTDTLLSSFTGMVYDGAGNRTYMSASIPAHTAYSGNTSYTYDTKDQLTQESSTRAGGYTNNFSYDSAGNATSFKGTSHSYNSNNQDTGNTYDGNGNPTTYSATTCTFDPENRMTAFGSALTASYRADWLRGKAVTSAGATYFLYDGEALLAEMNSAGSLTAVNTWGASGLLSRTSSAATTFYTFDPQSSVAQRLDGSGSVLTSHIIDGHGAEAATGAGDCYSYCARWGYYRDSATSLQLLTHRYYDTSSGRFTNRDPIGFDGGINLYSYGANEVTRRLDPSGLIYPYRYDQPPYATQTDPPNKGNGYSDWNPFTWNYNFKKDDWHHIADGVDNIANNEIGGGSIIVFGGDLGDRFTRQGVPNYGGWLPNQNIPGFPRKWTPCPGRPNSRYTGTNAKGGGIVSAVGGGILVGGVISKGIAAGIHYMVDHPVPPPQRVYGNSGAW